MAKVKYKHRDMNLVGCYAAAMQHANHAECTTLSSLRVIQEQRGCSLLHGHFFLCRFDASLTQAQLRGIHVLMMPRTALCLTQIEQ